MNRPETGWTAATLRLRNRRLPSCVLRVTVTRVPPEMITGTPPHTSRPSPATTKTRRAAHGFGRRSPTTKTIDDDESRDALARDADRGSDSDSDSDLSRVPETRGAQSGVPRGRDRARRRRRRGGGGPAHTYVPTPSGGESAAAGEEQTHALRSMSGVLIKEWSAFVLKEVRARKEVEQQMLELQGGDARDAGGVQGEVRATRQEWIGTPSFYGANVRDAREAAAAQRRKVARMARPRFPGGGPVTRSPRGAWLRSRRRRRVAMRRAAGRLTHTRLAKATAAWRQRARARRVARRAGRAGRPRRRRRRRRGALSGARRRATLADADAKRHERLVAALQRRAAGKMRLASASRAVAGWRERTRERRRLRGILRKTHARWTRAATADTFYAWLSVASGKRRRRARLSQLVLRVPNRERHAAFLACARGACGEKGTTCPVRAEPPVRPERAAVVLPPVERRLRRARVARRARHAVHRTAGRALERRRRGQGARTVAVRLRAARGRGGRRRRW